MIQRREGGGGGGGGGGMTVDIILSPPNYGTARDQTRDP